MKNCFITLAGKVFTGDKISICHSIYVWVSLETAVGAQNAATQATNCFAAI